MLTLHLSIILLLIVVNGFFAMAEIALVASRKARLQPLAELGNPGAHAALELPLKPVPQCGLTKGPGENRDHRDADLDGRK